MAGARPSAARLNEEVKAISARKDLPSDAIPALRQLNSTSVLANEKLTIVENANTALDALLNEGPRLLVDESKIFILRGSGNSKPSSNS